MFMRWRTVYLCTSRSLLHKMKIKVKKMSFQSILSTEIDLLEDSDEEKEFKRDVLLVCVLAEEYLSGFGVDRKDQLLVKLHIIII